MKPISNKIRELLIEAKKHGETGSYLPTPYPGRQPLLTSDKWEEIKALIESKPDKTLNEIIEELELPIHKSRLSVLLIDARYSFKKR